MLQVVLGTQLLYDMFDVEELPRTGVVDAWVLRIDDGEEVELWPVETLRTDGPPLFAYLIDLRMAETAGTKKKGRKRVRETTEEDKAARKRTKR